MTGVRAVRQVLVTGGAGYVGAVLVPRLLDGGYRVKVLDLINDSTEKRSHRVEVTPGRSEDRYRAAFEAAGCEGCPFRDSCRTEPLKCTPECVLRFSQQDIDLALRRQRSAEARASGQNLRSAVEATVRSVKHPFDDGKVPVRGQPRVRSMVVLASAAMSNLRRIHRYLVEKTAQEAEKGSQRGTKNDTGESWSSLFGSLWRQVQARLRLFTKPPAGNPAEGGYP